nr:MAG TPA: hypothetical protein [Caudoviricetes sp.]
MIHGDLIRTFSFCSGRANIPLKTFKGSYPVFLRANVASFYG